METNGTRGNVSGPGAGVKLPERRADPLAEALDHLQAPVRRAVVDDDNLAVRVGLVERALDRLGDVFLRVVAGDDDGDARVQHILLLSLSISGELFRFAFLQNRFRKPGANKRFHQRSDNPLFRRPFHWHSTAASSPAINPIHAVPNLLQHCAVATHFDDLAVP